MKYKLGDKLRANIKALDEAITIGWDNDFRLWYAVYRFEPLTITYVPEFSSGSFYVKAEHAPIHFGVNATQLDNYFIKVSPLRSDWWT